MILLLAAALLVQDPGIEGTIRDLARDLGNERIEVRERATADLKSLGPEALPVIRRLAETADLEVRERLLAGAREIERRQRLRGFLGKPAKITLKADALPLSQVVTRISKQAGTPVSLEGVAGDTPVSVSLEETGFFPALQEICRAHGGITFRFPAKGYRFGEGGTVKLVPGNPGSSRRFIANQFVVDIPSVYTTRSSDFRGTITETTALIFQLGWEGSTHPVGARFRVTSVVDEKGNPYKVKPSIFGDRRLESRLTMRQWVELESASPLSIRSFRKISGWVEFDFPSDGYIARVVSPEGKAGVLAEGGLASFTLQEFTRDGPAYRVRLNATTSRATGNWPSCTLKRRGRTTPPPRMPRRRVP